MRRFYVCPKDVFEGLHLIAGQLLPRYNLFHQGTGSHYMDLPGGFILLCTDFASEWAENEWHSQPEVARLTHPTLEGNVPLAQLHSQPQWAHKQFKPKHFAAISAAIPLAPNDTVWDLHSKLKAAGWVGLQLSNTY